MTTKIEVLDALPGCGKSFAIFKYMAEHNEKPWIYLSPMKDEINNRVPTEQDRVGLDFFIATEKSKETSYKTMTQQVLVALKEGRSVACTHNLMLRFSDEHIKEITEQGYGIVCDEELDLIKGYNELKPTDVKWLLDNKLIEISETDGKITPTSNIPIDSRYGDVQIYSSMGCLYAARTRNDFLVIQISPRIVQAASRFILLTYKYKGSLMDTFMQMHGFSFEYLQGVSLYKDEKQRIKDLRDLITFIETPTVKKWQNKKNCLSATWWRLIKHEDLEEVNKSIKSITKYAKCNSENLMITFPKRNFTGSDLDGKTSKIVHIDKIDLYKSFVQYNARATNEYRHKDVVIHALNLFPMQPVMVYMQDMGFVCDSESYALSTFVQWLFRSAIRDDKPIKVAILSDRMSTMFKMWLCSVDLE